MTKRLFLFLALIIFTNYSLAQLVRTFDEEHTGDVNYLDLSPDEKWILSASKDHTLRLWDINTGKSIKTFEGHKGSVYIAIFSPDGNHILSGSADHSVMLWDVQSGKLEKTFDGHTANVISLAFSSDGNHILSGSFDKTMKLWDVKTGKLVENFHSFHRPVTRVGFSLDGNYVIGGSSNNPMTYSQVAGIISSTANANDIKDSKTHIILKFWDIKTGKLHKTFDQSFVSGALGNPIGGNYIPGVDWTNDQKYALAYFFEEIRRWDIYTGELNKSIKLEKELKSGLLSQDGKFVCLGMADKTIKILDINKIKFVQTLQGHDGIAAAMCIGKNGSFLVTGAKDATIKLWNLNLYPDNQKITVSKSATNTSNNSEENTNSIPTASNTSVSTVPMKKVALVIGAKSYANVPPLVNTVNDAKDISESLKKKGFTVVEVYDPANKRILKDAMSTFVTQLGDGKDAIGFFYYSGHGMQVDGENYIIPTGAKLEQKADIEDECLNISHVLRYMETVGNPLNIIVLDACRNNPFRSFSRAADQGLGALNAPKGSYIVYATKPGSVAADGTGRNGLFTSKLLKYMDQPNLKIEEVFKQVAREVGSESNDKQRPWISSDYTGDFYFVEQKKK